MCGKGSLHLWMFFIELLQRDMCGQNEVIKRIASYTIKIIKFKCTARFRRANCEVWMQRVANRDLGYLMICLKPESSPVENSLSFTEAMLLLLLLLLFNLGQFNRRPNKHQRVSDLFPISRDNEYVSSNGNLASMWQVTLSYLHYQEVHMWREVSGWCLVIWISPYEVLDM